MKTKTSQPLRTRKNFAKSKDLRNALVVLVSMVVIAAFVAALQFNGVFSVAAQDSKEVKGDKIRPEAMKQINALTAEKNSRTAAQQKIDSRLLYRIKMENKQAVAEGVPTLETGVTVDDKGFVEVDITANVTKSLMAALRGINAEIIAALPQYRSITTSVPLLAIEALAARPDVIFIQPRQDATTNSSAPSVATPLFSTKSESDFLRGSLFQPPIDSFSQRAGRVREFLRSQLRDQLLIGSVTAESDVTHRSNLARSLTGFNGAGIKIGVMSNGVASLAARQGTGDLPAVTILPGQGGSGDEGTAMLEIVYDVAPGAQLYFATAFTSITSFAQNIKDLRTAGCDIIIDDVSYFVETPFQDGQAPSVVSPLNAGVVVQAVNDVTIGPQAGALYFSSAANSGNKNDNTSGAWEGDFVDGGATAAPIPLGNNVHDFGGGVTQNVLTVGNRTLLKWSDPLGGSSNDYDLFVLNSAGTAVVISSTNIQSGTQDPSEDVGTRAAGERIVIVKKAGAANRFLHLNTNRGRLTVSTAGVIYGHNGGRNSISTAATPAGPAVNSVLAIGPFPNAHSGSNVVEIFSSDGPRRIFYNADSSLITPGNVSSTGGEVLQKPDITAADGVTTTTPTFIPFFGTSAAAPQAGALMALVKQASPASTRVQLFNAMIGSAIDIEAPGTDRDSGAGIFMPLPAMNALSVAGPAYIDKGLETATEGAGNGDTVINAGEVWNLSVPLDNLGLSNATNISATLSTSTPLVTILPSATRSYPNLAAAIGSGTSATPYAFRLAPNFPCGAAIAFTLTVTYVGGSSPQVINFSVDTGTPTVVASTLDAVAPVAGMGFTASTNNNQTGRLVRNGVASTCAAPKAAPGLNDATAGRRYDAYVFTASTSGCVTVTLTAANNDLFLAAYNNAGYNPANPNLNYLADAGSSFTTTTLSFNAVAGQQYTIVVHEVVLGAGNGDNYGLNVEGPRVGACFGPSAAGVAISGRVTTSVGRSIANASVVITDAAGNPRMARTNTFGYFTFEDVPSGETYILSTNAKRYRFSPIVLSVSDDIEGVIVLADP